MVNLSYFYFTAQDGDLAAIRRQVPQAAVYVEMCHTTRVGPVVGVKACLRQFLLPPHDPGAVLHDGAMWPTPAGWTA